MEFQTRNACSNLTLELEPPSAIWHPNTIWQTKTTLEPPSAIWHPNTIWQANSSQSFPDLQSANKCSNVDMCAFASSLFMLSFKIVLFTWHHMKHKTKHDYKLMMFETQIKCHLLHDLVMAIVASMFLSPQKHSNVPECTKQQKGHGQRSSNKKDSPHCFPALMVFVLFKHWNNVSFFCLNKASSACIFSMLHSMVLT